MADMQTTLSLVLQAKDEASSVLHKVGDEMLRLAQEAEALQKAVQLQGGAASNVDALKAMVAQRLAAEKESHQQSLNMQRMAQDEGLKAIQAQGREELAVERDVTAQKLQQSRLRRAAELQGHNQYLNDERAKTVQNAEAERTMLVQQAEKRLQDARGSHEADLAQAQQWLEKRRAQGSRADEAARTAMQAPGAPQLDDAQIKAWEEHQARAAAQIDQIWTQTYESMVREANETFAQIATAAKEGGEQLVAASHAFEQAELAQLEKWRVEGTESINDMYAQRNALAREALRQESEAIRVAKDGETREYKAAEEMKTDILKQQSEERQRIIKAANEQLQAEAAENRVGKAAGTATELQRSRDEALRAMPAPAITRRPGAELSPEMALMQQLPSEERFKADLAAIAAGAGTVEEKLVAMRGATEKAASSFRTFYQLGVDEVKMSATMERTAIAEGLRGQLADVKTYVDTQVTLIKASSKQIQQLLREAYSAPGMTEAMRADIQQMIRDNEAGQQALVTAARRGGDNLREQAQRTAQVSTRELDNSLDAQLTKLRTTLSEEVRLRKQASDEMAVTMRHAAGGPEEFEKSLTHIKEASETVLGPLSHVVEMGQQMLVWGIGYQMVMSVYSALTQAAGGLITVNAGVEQLGMTFAALYQTSQQGGQAIVTWLNQFAALVPGTREQVQQAALSFASAGDSIRDILPAASNLAAIMGVDLPRAAQAMVDAQMGRFEMMQMTLHTTKQELQAYGLEVEHTGHVVASTFVPAVERYTAVRFGEHVQMDTQAVQALHAALGNAGSAFQGIAQGAAMVSAGALPGEGTVDPKDPTRASQVQAQRQVAVVNAFSAAMRGNLGQLSGLFGVTAGDLDKIDTNWKKTEASARAAIEQWFKANYGINLSKVTEQTSAIYKQMNTLSGAFSNVQDSLTNLQQIMGQGMFNALEQQVRGVYNALQSPALAYFAAQLGQTLGDALNAIIGRFKEWYASIGGLPGLLRLLQTAGQDLWGVMQGLGDALGTVGSVLSVLLSPITAILDLFGILGARSKDGAGSLRFMTAAVVDLFAAFKAYQILDAVWESIMKVVEAARAAAIAQRATAVAAGQAATAQGGLAVAQTAAAMTAMEEDQEARDLIGTLLEEDEVSATATMAAGARALPSGLLIPAGATTAGETVAGAATGAAVGAETVGLGEAAMGGITALGGAAVAAATPLLGMVAAILPVIVALDAFRDNLQLAKDEQHKALVKPFVPPQLISAIPTAQQAVTESHIHDALSYYRGGFGAASGTAPPAGAESTADPYSQFMRMLPKQGQTLLAHYKTGTGQQLLENETAFLAYLQSYPDALKKLNEVLKAAHKPQVTSGQIETALEQLRTGQMGYSQKDVDAAKQQVVQTSSRLNADLKSYQSDIVGQVNTLREATSQLTLTKTGDMDKAVAAGSKAVNDWAEKNWRQFSEKTKTELASQPDLFDPKWITAHWKQMSASVQDAFKQQGLGPGAPGGQPGYTADTFNAAIQGEQTQLQTAIAQNAPWSDIQGIFKNIKDETVKGAKADIDPGVIWKALHDSIDTISKMFASKLQWDESLGMPAKVIRADITTWTTNLRALGATNKDLAQALVPAEIKAFKDTLLQEMLLPYQTVQKDFSDLAARLKKEGATPDEIAAILSQTWQEYYTAKVANLKAELTAEAATGVGPSGGAMTTADAWGQIDDAWNAYLKANAAAIKAHKPGFSPAEMQQAHNELTDAYFKPQVQAAQAQLEYDEAIKAPQAKILADYQAYAAALDQTSATATEKAYAEVQARQRMAQNVAQSANLQLQYDQMLQKPWPVILADINNISTTMTGASEDFRTVAIKTHDLLVAAAQKEEQAQQSYIQYAETMDESWSVIISHVNARARAMIDSGTSPIQVTMARGQDIQQAADGLLQNALDTGASFKTAHDIIMEGAQALREAGYSRIAVERWMTMETKKAFDPFLQQAETAGKTAFDMAVTQGRVQTPQQVMAYVNAQMAMERQKPLAPGETQAERAITLQAAQMALVKQGFDGLTGWAQKSFDWDTSGGNAAQALKDENRILALDMLSWKAQGLTPAEIKLLHDQTKYQLDQTRTGGYTRPTEPAYTAYGGLGRQPGFGGVEVMFGGPSTSPFQAMISILQSQLAEAQQQSMYWKNQALKDEAQLRANQQTAQNTGRIAANTQGGLGPGHEPVPVSNPVATTRRHGTSPPVTRP